MFLFALAAEWDGCCFRCGMKMRLGINEIITTLLMNYVAANFMLHLLFGPGWIQ